MWYIWHIYVCVYRTPTLVNCSEVLLTARNWSHVLLVLQQLRKSKENLIQYKLAPKKPVTDLSVVNTMKGEQCNILFCYPKWKIWHQVLKHFLTLLKKTDCQPAFLFMAYLKYSLQFLNVLDIYFTCADGNVETICKPKGNFCLYLKYL